ncbi:LOW QUALITY PROTEIN: sodium-dependent glucose transporter 1A-like [Haliotis rubra]|uniref:LOW QUALITY PROTEIN: sodium-dependent glucose transporter 1A-like n=1 Tax=Haliotis rubra TaxID=36100 RepID=UPI001EE58948|nr:LOW QUALITY PROTEIN: sodium-dependent glucose transporter 1A-like [Haliotis rubra]
METSATVGSLASEEELDHTRRRWANKLRSTLYKKKFLYTACLLFGNFMSGWVNGQRGPSLLDLQIITGTDLSQGSAFFTAAATGSLVGAVAGGAIYDRFNKYLSLFISMAGHGLTVAVIPLCSPYWLMIAMFVAHEFFLGIFKTGCNVELVRVWGVESKPYMQALHFLWSLGGIISPFVLEPFLAVRKYGDNNATRSSVMETQNSSYEVQEYVNASSDHHLQTRIIWPFFDDWAVNHPVVFTVLNSVSICKTGKHKDATKALEGKRQGKMLSRKLLVLTLGLLGIFYFFLDEVEDSSVSFLTSYVVMQFNWTKVTGARITSAFWAAYAFGRLAAIVFIGYVSHVKICGVFFSFLILAQVGMIFAGMYLSKVFMWITACAVGFSISISFPAMLTWIEKDFVQLSGKIMSVIFIAVGLGGMVNPQIIGHLMQVSSPLWYNYILTIESVLLFLSFLMLVWLVKKVLSKHHSSYTVEGDPTVEIEEPLNEKPSTIS